jgi:hypothetical protein
VGVKLQGPEILTPEEWNAVVDALNELDNRISAGQASFTGDGTTTTFNIPHGLGEVPWVVMVGKGSANLPDIDYFTADAVNISVVFKSAPASGANVRIWWIAIKTPSPPPSG